MFKVLACMSAQHNWWLVALAVLVCIPSTLATFFLFSRVPVVPGWRRWTWLSMTAVVAARQCTSTSWQMSCEDHPVTIAAAIIRHRRSGVESTIDRTAGDASAGVNCRREFDDCGRGGPPMH